MDFTKIETVQLCKNETQLCFDPMFPPSLFQKYDPRSNTQVKRPQSKIKQQEQQQQQQERRRDQIARALIRSQKQLYR